MLIQIDAAMMNYPWGSTESVQRLFGLKNADGVRIAELWYGAHSKAPSTIPGSSENLRDKLLADPESLIGHTLSQAYGGEFPFLFKVLAANKGLSIQAHPSLEQARLGYEKENEEGIALDAPNRNYRDANHKPEAIIALEEFWALSGFRKSSDISQALSQCSENTLAAELIKVISESAEPLKDFYTRLMTSPLELQQSLLTDVLAVIGDSVSEEDSDPRWYWIRELSRQFPGDNGALAPLYLNVLRLEKGQALFMYAGILHAYLRGTGYEIMANSDNVLRGGCTGKHVDVPELLRSLKFTDEAPQLVPRDEIGWYESPVPEFQIADMNLKTGEPVDLRTQLGLGDRPAIILVSEGSLFIQETDSAGSEVSVELHKGQSLFITVPDAAQSGQLKVSALSAEVSFAVASVNN